ncbi:MAG: c-type cytochrome [Opitutaceae bacterium]|nr:c-type cytochrome [Opitutaceae bacterium]
MRRSFLCFSRLFALFCLLIVAPLSAQRGDAPDAKLLPAAESRALFHLPPGFEIQLVAAEPDLEKPFNLAFDSFGRVWVTGSKLYPWPAKRDALGEPIASFDSQWGDTGLAFRAASTPPEPPERGLDTVRVLSDFDPATGRARQSIVFADGLNIPVGVLPLPRAPGAKGDTALVFSIPAIWRLTDTDGDGRADVREKLYDGFGFKDTHGMSSSYWLWFDGWVYGTHGFANKSEVVDRAGRAVTLTSGNTYRFRPDGSRFEVFVHGQTNPYGLAFDARGDLYTADSHSKPVYLLIPGGYYEGIGKEHDGLGFAPAITTDDHGSSAIAGLAHYSAAHFPPEYRDNLFNGNPVTRRINRARLEWRGSTPIAARQPDFLTSDDPAFRPVQVKLGPDGALWIADFYNPIIGHYEAPLTHPARDQKHGRIWRIVWRGLDGNAPLPTPTLPNLAKLNTTDLVSRLSDSNLVVRSLAYQELSPVIEHAALVIRPDARLLGVHRAAVAQANVAAIFSAASRLVAGTDANADGTAALPLFFALDQITPNGAGHRELLGKLGLPKAETTEAQSELTTSLDDLLRRALTRPDSAVAHAALRVLAARDRLPDDAEKLFSTIAGGGGSPSRPHPASPGYSWRLIADALARHPQPWGAPLLLTMLGRAPEADTELIYALRLALKNHARDADAATLAAWAAASPGDATRVADLALALGTPAAARFLAGHVRAAKTPDARIGDFARHIALQLPADEFGAFTPLLRPLGAAPAAQRLIAAEGLATIAAKPNRTLPADIAAWMQRELFAALDDRPAPAVRAANALKPLALPEKAAPLRRRALASAAAENVRAAALRALAPGEPETEETAATVLASNAPQAARRAAADVIGASVTPGPAARAALTGAFATASADLALGLAIALAKSDAGAADLLDLAAAGRVRATLLKHRYVATQLEKRPAAIRARAEELTRAAPSEDARLDALIAARLGAAGSHKPVAARGAPLFATHCAACHRFRDTGGNLGPSLDGIGSRATPRLVEDILDPSRNVDPVFRLTTITLRNGETKSGLNHRDDGAFVWLADPAGGPEIVMAKGDVASVAPSAVSPMPAAFETALTESEFFDLLEFLRSPAR